MDDEGIVSETTCVGEAVHTLADFDVHEAVVDEGSEIVEFDDLGWDDVDGNPHVFFPFHGGHEIEIFDISCHEACLGGGENTVEKDFRGPCWFPRSTRFCRRRL